jgi:hypothetical protein
MTAPVFIGGGRVRSLRQTLALAESLCAFMLLVGCPERALALARLAQRMELLATPRKLDVFGVRGPVPAADPHSFAA